MGGEIYKSYKNHYEENGELFSNHDGSSNPLLSAAFRKDSPPSSPHRFDHDGQKRQQERMTFSGNMGKVVEKCVFRVWSGDASPSEEAKEEIGKILDGYLPKVKDFYTSKPKQDRPEHIEMADYFSKMFIPTESMDDNFIPVIRPEDEKLAKLLEILEGEYGINGVLSGYFDDIARYGVANEEVRYFAETLFIISKELVNPTFKTQKGLIIPNVRIQNGNLAGQFDGIYMPNPQINNIDDFGFWKHTPYRKWIPIETKVSFRARFLTGKRWIKGPFTWDIAQTQERLGKIMIEAFRSGKKFRLPESLVFVYLRGVLPNNIFNQRVDSFFVGWWANGIEEKLMTLASRYPEDKVKDARILFFKLKELQKKLKVKEDRNKKKIGTIQGEQKPLSLNVEEGSTAENKYVAKWIEDHEIKPPKKIRRKKDQQNNLF